MPILINHQQIIPKIEIGLAKGKKLYDKREAIAKKDAQMKINRALKNNY